MPLEAMKCDVPVITSSTGAMPEICSNAALYADPQNFKDIAENMMLIFKDEKRRKELIEKGRERIKKCNWDKSALLVWKSIQNVLPNPLN